MNQRMLIKKTLRKKRGYKYHTYETVFEEKEESEELCLYHYGTLILRMGLSEGVPLSFRITSVSDRDMVNVALGQIDTRNSMRASKSSIRERISKERFLKHKAGGGPWLFDKAERVDRDDSVLVIKNLQTRKAEAFETSTRRRKFWLREAPEGEDQPDLYGRDAREFLEGAKYIGSISENRELMPLVVGHTLKRSFSSSSLQ